MTTTTLFDVDAPAVGIDVAVAGDLVVAGVPGLAAGEQNTQLLTSTLLGAGHGAGISVDAGRVVVRDGGS